MGNRGRTVAGDVQVMSAGSGIRHSEYNWEAATTRLFQIWIEPSASGGSPSWAAKPFPRNTRLGGLVALASGLPGDDEALRIRAPARVLGVTLTTRTSVEYELGPDRHAYLVPRLKMRRGSASQRLKPLKLS